MYTRFKNTNTSTETNNAQPNQNISQKKGFPQVAADFHIYIYFNITSINIRSIFQLQRHSVWDTSHSREIYSLYHHHSFTHQHGKNPEVLISHTLHYDSPTILNIQINTDTQTHSLSLSEVHSTT